MNYLFALYRWTFKHLPRKFSVPLVALLAAYFLVAFPLALRYFVKPVAERLAGFVPVLKFPWEEVAEQYVFKGIVEALLTVTFALLGVLLSYWVAALTYGMLRKGAAGRVEINQPVPPGRPAPLRRREKNPLEDYRRIGIILAGGGAKGAYQAGAMKAVYEFIEKCGAHDRVKMIAGTSIGSWNAMFWLTHQIKGPEGKPGLLEQWWHQVDVQSVIRPDLYLPLRRNYFLSSQPWQETFEEFFVKNEGAREILEGLISHADQRPDRKHDDCGKIHFYFTRSNVARGQLEFTTNRDDLSDIQENLPIGRRPRPPVPPDAWEQARKVYAPGENVVDIFGSVFASMDLPPLFKYWPFGDKQYEDGGVVDNLPVRFGAELEKCDLLFVLPLNANFEQDVDTRSIINRLFRVMDVRQGVLERNAFKLAYLYNELAALRERAERYERVLCAIDEDARRWGIPAQDLWHAWMMECVTSERMGEASKWLDRHERNPLAEHTQEDEEAEREEAEREEAAQRKDAARGGTAALEGREADRRALVRKHRKVQIFSICPAPELIISTAEFWKTKEAGQAFRLMHAYTKYELEKFFRDPNLTRDWVRMAQVSRHGTVTYLEDF